MASPEVSVTVAAEQHSEGDTPVTESPATAPSKTDASSEIDTTCLSLPVGILVGPPSCPGVCCHKGNDWVRRHYDVERFPKDMGVEGLDTYAWKPLSGGIPNLARFLREYGLAPWKELPPVVRERMSLWSPVAQHLWESEFEEHQEALVRAWIWHYIDDNLLSFLEDDSSGEPLHCAAPVWSHVRALYRELDVLRSGQPSVHPWDQERHRVQYHFWRRLTDSLVREGLGLELFVEPADLVSHFKASLRLLLVEGQAQIPDYPFDGDWDHRHKWNNRLGTISDSIKSILRGALTLQESQKSMILDCRVRFTPIGSDKHWGFPLDDEWMRGFSPFQIPETRPEEPMPLVQLVSAPMLVLSGKGGWNYEKNFELWPRAHMEVVAPWTFGGEEAKKHFVEGYDKDECKPQKAANRADYTVKSTGMKRKETV